MEKRKPHIGNASEEKWNKFGDITQSDIKTFK